MTRVRSLLGIGAAAACAAATSALAGGWLVRGRSVVVAPTTNSVIYVAGTARADLDRTIAAMERRLAAAPADAAAAVALADALLRQTRVTGNAGLAGRAESALKTVLADEPMDYLARRSLATVYLSQHRFRDAIRESDRCRAQLADDAWIDGVLGDAHLELGEYDDAFEAFERMVALRPDAASYARASYARELQGDLDGALRLMTMAAAATPPQDAESLAWHDAQIGHLYLELERPRDARRAYERAAFVFPNHPFAIEGLARVEAAEGHHQLALGIIERALASSPTPSAAAFTGDMLEAMGMHDEAERQYALAEAAWRVDAPEPSRLARFFAEHGRHLDEAVRLAESVDRDDIFTNDALAWACFRRGDVDRARTAIARALRTGTRDRGIRAHADAIRAAAGPR